MLRQGARRYVLGEADRYGDLEIGKPSSGKFIVSTRTEEELTKSARTFQQVGMAVGAGLAVIGLLLLILAFVV